MFEIFNEVKEDIEELKDVTNLLKKVVKKEKLEATIFNIIIIDNKKIQELNKEYRNKDESTDVISFALEDYEDITYEFRLLGDIYISLDKAKEQSIKYKHSLKRELCFLTIHGLLHLLGYSHEDKENEKIMFDKQEEILDEIK